MNNKKPVFLVLIAYYGILQTIHIIAILTASFLLLRTGEITFLAQPPLGGWSTQARHFLIGLGAVGAVNALLSMLFVYGYFSNRSWWFSPGLMTLTVSVCSAVIYAYGTVASAAWVPGNAASMTFIRMLQSGSVFTGMKMGARVGKKKMSVFKPIDKDRNEYRSKIVNL